MDVTLQCSALAGELALARRIGERKTTIPVYAFARLQADGDRLRIGATDGESALMTDCAAAVTTPGTVLVQTKTLHDMARAAGDGDLRLTIEKGRVRVVSGQFAATLQTLPVDQFPALPEAIPASICFGAASLAEAFGRVRFVAETSGPATYRHGALLEIEPGRAHVVTTDGHRIAKASIVAPTDAVESTTLLPRKAVDDLVALLDTAGKDATVAYGRDERRAYFLVGERLYVTVVMEFTFPNYTRVIPKSAGSRVEIQPEACAALLQRVALVATDKTLRVGLSFEKKRLVASMQSAEIGEAVEELPIKLLRGEAWTSGFAVKYLREFLQAAPSGPVTLDQQDEKAIAVLRAGEDYLYVLAPMMA